MDLFEEAKGYSGVCIAGMCKNAGKTTVLNAFIRAYHRHGADVAVTSIGRDGESNDVVFNVAKPEVFLKKGDLAATAKGLLPLCTVSREILCATGIPTPLGEVVVFRALSDGFVQIAGPSIVAQLAELKKIFLSLGAHTVFFDGALGRKSLCSPEVAEAAILASGASLSKKMDVTVEETALVAKLLTLKTCPTSVAERLLGVDGVSCVVDGDILTVTPQTPLPDGVNMLFLSGALTNEHVWLLDVAATQNIPLTVENGANVLADRDVVEKFFKRGGELLQMSNVKLLAVTVNPFSVFGYEYDALSFEKKMREAVDVPVLNIKNIRETK